MPRGMKGSASYPNSKARTGKRAVAVLAALAAAWLRFRAAVFSIEEGATLYAPPAHEIGNRS